MRERLSNLGNTTPFFRHLYLVLGTALLPAIWVIVSEFHLIKELYFPSPQRVFAAAFDIRPNIFVQSMSTVGLSILGYLI
jgi:ABC-type nitrate/sulfonate/bicarbonate transport system permease component